MSAAATAAGYLYRVGLIGPGREDRLLVVPQQYLENPGWTPPPSKAVVVTYRRKPAWTP